MNQRELVAMQQELGEAVACCQWCHEWKPYSKLYRSVTTRDGLGRFLGLVTCNSCYYKFRKIVTTDEVVPQLFGWLEKNLGVKIVIRQVTVKCRETREFPKG